MAVLFLCAGFLTYYYHAILDADVIFTHLFYIPIVLASIWWKRRGIAVAVLLGLLLLVSHVLFAPDLPLVPDLFRAAMFVVIAAVVAVLSEQTASAGLLYKSLAGNSHTGVYILQDGKLQYVNQRAIEYTGFSEDELMQMSPLDWVHPDDKEETQKNAIQMLKGIRKAPYEFRVFARDGRIKWILETVTPIQFRGRKAILGNAMDITDSKRAEEALRESEALFRKLFEDHTAVKLIIDPDTGSLIDANEAAAQYYGWSRERLKAMKIAEINTLVPEEVKKEMEKARANKRTHFEFRHRLADGSIRDVAVFSSRIEVKGKDFLHSIVHDITESRRAEEALRESEERFRRLENATWEGIIIHREGIIMDANESALKMIGYPAEEVIGQSVLMLLAPESIEPALQKLKESIDTPQIYFEAKGLRKDKTVFPVEVMGRPIRYRNLDARVIALRDITERKEKTAEIEMKSILLDSASDSIIVMDLEGSFQYMNESAYKSRGYSREELMAMNLKELDDPAYRDAIPSRFKEIMEKGMVIFESAHRRKDGSVMPVEVHSRLIRMEGQELFFSIIRDITERKRVEEALQESEERFKKVSGSAKDAIIMIDDEGIISFWNEAAENMFGHSSQEAVGKNCHRLIAPQRFHEAYEQGIIGFKNTGQGFAIGKSLELVALRSDGTEFPVELSLSVTQFQNRWSAIGIVRDITERKRAEDALKESEKKYNELAHFLPQIVFEADIQGNLTFVNNAAYSISGYSPEDFKKGLNALQMLVPEDRERAGLNMKRIMRGEEIQDNEYTFLRKDGKTFSVITESIPIVRNNQIVGLRGIIIDITERKQLEAKLSQARKMESLGQLASGAAHEIRNPLNIMSLRLQMLDVTGKALDDDVRKAIDTCNNQIRRITGVLEGLQEFSRISEIRKTRDDLNKIVEEAMTSQAGRLRGEGVTAEIRYGEDIPLLMMDKEKMVTAINHLISNAADAMKDREIKKLRVSTGKAPSGENVRVVVSDTGHGIKEADRARIFDPFFTTKDPDKGKGLGLSIAYRIISDHDGTIRAENNEQGGATFIVELPA